MREKRRSNRREFSVCRRSLGRPLLGRAQRLGRTSRPTIIIDINFQWRTRNSVLFGWEFSNITKFSESCSGRQHLVGILGLQNGRSLVCYLTDSNMPAPLDFTFLPLATPIPACRFQLSQMKFMIMWFMWRMNVCRSECVCVCAGWSAASVLQLSKCALHTNRMLKYWIIRCIAMLRILSPHKYDWFLLDVGSALKSTWCQRQTTHCTRIKWTFQLQVERIWDARDPFACWSSSFFIFALLRSFLPLPPPSPHSDPIYSVAHPKVNRNPHQNEMPFDLMHFSFACTAFIVSITARTCQSVGLCAWVRVQHRQLRHGKLHMPQYSSLESDKISFSASSGSPERQQQQQRSFHTNFAIRGSEWWKMTWMRFVKWNRMRIIRTACTSSWNPSKTGHIRPTSQWTSCARVCVCTEWLHATRATARNRNAITHAHNK